MRSRPVVVALIDHGSYLRVDIDRKSELYLDRYGPRNCYGVGIYYNMSKAILGRIEIGVLES